MTEQQRKELAAYIADYIAEEVERGNIDVDKWMVLDALATGRAGHAARSDGDSALERALRDIAWLHSQPMTTNSAWLGQSKVTVTSIHTPNVQHNVVPDECRFVVDVRLNEHYQPAEALEFLQRGTESVLTPRSMRFRPKSTPEFHPVVARAIALGGAPYGSPTCSDWSQVQVAALKIGPGSSSRSHTADEFIYIHEVRDAVPRYLQLLDALTPP